MSNGLLRTGFEKVSAARPKPPVNVIAPRMAGRKQQHEIDEAEPDPRRPRGRLLHSACRVEIVPLSASDLRTALKGLDSLRYGVGDLDEALRRIVATTHDLFSVDGAALMLIDAEFALRNAAVSDPRLEQL